MIIELLNQKLETVLKKLKYENHNFKIIPSNREDLCDYQFDGCFSLAKLLHQSPIEIGEKIVQAFYELPDFNDLFEKVELVKPGFINFVISESLINQFLQRMDTMAFLGIERPKKVSTFVLDYGGPNIAKPLHVGHMRTAIVGEAIKRIIQYMGHKTIADVHLGDYGLQIGQVIYGIKQDGISLERVDLAYLEKTYPRISALCKENEEIKQQCSEITRKLQEGDFEYQKLWKKICELSLADIKRLYRYLDVSFDVWYGESDSYQYIHKVEDILNQKHLLEESEGAKIVKVNQEEDKKDLPPFLFQSSNQTYLYGTTDLATIYQREKDNHPDFILYVVDNRQALHFKQVFRVAKKADITHSQLEFLGYGTVNGMDGKPYKTRKGDAPKLDSLFQQVKEIFKNKKESNQTMSEEDQDKIVNAILKFADLQNSREKDYIFDISKFSEVVGKTGPYILYTYLRINKIIKENTYKKILTGHIYNNYDRNLRIKLIALSTSLQQAFEYRMPHYVADYIYELCVAMNTFYQNNHIHTLEDENQKNMWLSLLELSNKVLKEMLNLLMIDVPTSM